MNRFPILDGAALASAEVSAIEAMDAIEAGLAAWGRGEAQQPHPPALRPAAGGFFQPLIATLPAENVACVNWLAYHPGNVAFGHPHSSGLLILNDLANGETFCLMDGLWVSHRRTGYVAALAVKYLAGGFGDVALIGAGAIAVFATEALAAIGRICGELRVCARTPAGARRFCADAVARLGIKARPVMEPREAVRGVRLVVTSTTHAGPPFIERDWLDNGTLVVMIDRLRVVTPGLLAQADRIVPNSRESLAGWGFEDHGQVRQTLPEIIAAGQPLPVAAGEIVLCDAGGLAVADLAYAALLWQRWKDRV